MFTSGSTVLTLLTGLIAVGVSALVSMIMCGLAVAIHRQLSGTGEEALESVFE